MAEAAAAGPAGAGAAQPPSRTWGADGEPRSVRPTEPQRDLLRAALMRDERGLAAWRRIRDSIEPGTLDDAPATLPPHVARNLRAQGFDDPRLELFEGVRRFTWARNQFLVSRCLPIVAEAARRGIPTA